MKLRCVFAKDPRTAQFYATNAADLARRYIAAGSAPARHFAIAFTPGSRVLDIGCGSGRDVQALLDAGYDANGIDATHEMLGEAKARYPALATRVSCDTLPNLSGVADASYDGILCWAVLMHLPEEFLFDTVFNLRPVLKSGGRLLISTPLDGPTTDPNTLRDPHRRLFNVVTPENFRFLPQGTSLVGPTPPCGDRHGELLGAGEEVIEEVDPIRTRGLTRRVCGLHNSPQGHPGSGPKTLPPMSR